MTKEILEELCSQHLLQIGELSCIVIRALNGEIAAQYKSNWVLG